MNTRKFTYSEVRAYTRNRYEEKNLRVRLQKLTQQLGEFYDSTAKHRSNLIDECRQMRKTSGGSPSRTSTMPESDFEFSTRVNRPWAYSVMESTYNVVYRNAVIPIPKRLGNKCMSHKAKSFCGENNDKKSRSFRVFSSKSMANPPPTHMLLTNQRENTEPILSCDRQKGTNMFSPGKGGTLSEHNVEPISRSWNPEETEAVTRNISLTASGPSLDVTLPSDYHNNNGGKLIDQSTSLDQAYIDTGTNNDVSISTSNKQNKTDNKCKDTGVKDNYTEDTRQYNTKLISLPAVYKIDSDEYQNSMRKRMIRRARSRIEPTQNALPNTTNDAFDTESEQKTFAAVAIQEERPDNYETGKLSTAINSENDKFENQSMKSGKEKELNVLISLDSTMTDVHCVKAADTVVYRGKLIHNYIRPEDRYKLDPLIIKRRQNRMDKLSKESATFLKRVNHENIRVEIAFPRSTRQRLLTRLVDENNSDKGRKRKSSDEIYIQSRVQDFTASISNYVFHQRLNENKLNGR